MKGREEEHETFSNENWKIIFNSLFHSQGRGSRGSGKQFNKNFSHQNSFLKK